MKCSVAILAWALTFGLWGIETGAQVMISEFMAINGRTLPDQDGDYSDWIELENLGDAEVNLEGWYLTDDAQDRRKWRLPSVTIGSKGFLLMFASGKNRSVAGQELHTNFQLDDAGEYLALVRPDGLSVASQFAPQYPPQRADVAYGRAAPSAPVTLVAPGDTASVLIPANDSLGSAWTGVAFVPQDWTQGATGIGYGIAEPSEPPAANRLLWLAANTDLATNSAGTITAWADAGGAHGNWIESIRGSPRQATVTFPQGNRAVIRFKGNSDGLALIDDAQLRVNPLSIYIVASVDAGEQSAIIISNYQEVNGYAVGISDAVNQRVKWFTAPAGDELDDGSPSFPAGNLVSEKNYLISATFDSLSNAKVLRLRDERSANERTVAGSFHRQAEFAVDTQLTIGNLDFGRQFFDGDVAEILVYSSVSTAQRDAVESYLMNKYFVPQLGTGNPSALVGTDVASLMAGLNSSAYLRIPFQLGAAMAFTKATLRIQYDDGFVAYLDGQEIMRRNAPGTSGTPLPFNATASSDRPPALARAVEAIDVTRGFASLPAGLHVLAIQGLNDALASPDFLIRTELTAEVALPTPVSVGYLKAASPTGPNNTEAYGGAVAPLQFSVRRGFYAAPVRVEMTSATPGAQIRYTLDGSVPTAERGTVYTVPLTISQTTTLRAAAFRPDYLPGEVETHSYIFVNDVIRQSPTGKPPVGWPASPLPTGQVLQYGMDPRIVDSPLYSGLIRAALESIPTFSIVMEQSALFGPLGIYAHASADGREWERPASVELIHPDGTTGFQIDAGIRIRGGQSRMPANPKHAFRLFFRKEYGDGPLRYRLFQNSAIDRFGLIDLRVDQNDSWSFVGDCCGSAANATYLRDVFVRDTQLAMGQPATRSEFYHLYLNGQYWGLGDTEERPEADFAASYFGGEPADYDVIKINWGPFTVYASDGDMSAWTDFYNRLKAGVTSDAAYQFLLGNNPDGTRNPAFKVYLDANNLIDFMLLTLYSGNLDSAISTFARRPNNWYALRNRNGMEGFRFFCHDAELTLLDVNADRTSPPVNVGDASVLDSSPEWMWHKLLANAAFKSQVADRVHKHFFNDGVFTPASAKTRFLRRQGQIDLAIIGESARWGDARRATPYTRNVEWLGLINKLAVNTNCYFDRRASIVLNQLLADGLYPKVVAPSFNQFGGTVAPGFALTMSAPAGTVYYTLDGSDPRTRSGAVAPGARVYSQPLPLNESAMVKARVLSATTWSALNEALFNVTQNFKELLLTEIMYHPPNLTNAPGSTLDDDEFEFVELKNAGAAQLDLSGVHFAAGITYVFPLGTRLGPGEFIVLASNPTAFAIQHPDVPVSGQYQGHLSNQGETLALVDAADRPIHSVTYLDQAPWPPAAAGLGFSLVPIQPQENSYPDDPASWRASWRPGGSPGADDPQSDIPFVRINEVLARPEAPELDAIELHNPNPFPVTIGYWFLSDDRQTPKKFQVPPGQEIPANGFVVFTERDFNPTPGVASSFALNSRGEEVWLHSADAAGNLTGFGDGFAFGASPHGLSFGRYVNSVGEVQYSVQERSTLGTTNAGPKIGPVVINEIYYHPAPGDEAFIELRNLTDTAIPLYDPAHPANTWRLKGVGFDFPTNTDLAPHGFILLVPTDPSAFRARYLVPIETPVLGPYSGVLQAQGELLQLQQPAELDTGANGSITVPYVTVDEVRYSNLAPWPTHASGTGRSLERLDSMAYGNDPINWRASPDGPSPGLDNTGNRPPQVLTGEDQQLQAERFPLEVTLPGAAEDDGLPAPPARLTTTWSLDSGPGPVVFADPSRSNTTVRLPGQGRYVLRFTASDGVLTASETVTLSVERPLIGTTVLVPAGSVWNYLDNGSNQGTAWRSPDFNDAAWKTNRAQLGYGDGDEATVISFGPNSSRKFITSYFRKAFTVTHAKQVTQLILKLIRDDGAVVYLNGDELFRSNMASGNITFTNLATDAISDSDESTFFPFEVDPARLREGANALAVEVHQQNQTSSDVSFDLELSAILLPLNQAPTVNAGPDQTLSLGAVAQLNGTFADDALPNPPGIALATWSKVAGPGTVTFDDPQRLNPTARFSLPGIYGLRLTITDGEFIGSDDLTITLANGGPEIPKLDPVTGVSGTNLVFRLRFTTQAAQGYTIQFRDSLATGAWERLQDLDPQPAPYTAEVTDPFYPARPSRYYRIVSPKQP